MALLLPGKRVILWVPRTAGTWLKAVLESGGVPVEPFLAKHACHGDIRLNRDDWNDYETACFVRHPETWLRSYWQFQCSGSDGKGDWYAHEPPLAPLRECASYDFDEFVREVCRRLPGFVGDYFNRFTREASIVARFEDKKWAVPRLTAMWGLEFDSSVLDTVPRLNESRPSGAALSERTREMLLRSEEPLLGEFYDEEVSGGQGRNRDHDV